MARPVSSAGVGGVAVHSGKGVGHTASQAPELAISRTSLWIVYEPTVQVT